MSPRPSSSTTLNRQQLVNALYKRLGLPKTLCADMVETMISEISAAIVRDRLVKLASFGAFRLRLKNARIGRNPRNGVEVAIPPRWVIRFRASPKLKARMNNDQAAA